MPVEVNKTPVSPSYVKIIYRTLTKKLIIECKELVINVKQGGFLYVIYLTLLHLRPSDSTVSEDAGIEPRAVATLASDTQTIRLDLIRNSARSHLLLG